VAGGLVAVPTGVIVGISTVGGGAVGIVWLEVLARPVCIRKDSKRNNTSTNAVASLIIWFLRFLRVLFILVTIH